MLQESKGIEEGWEIFKNLENLRAGGSNALTTMFFGPIVAEIFQFKKSSPKRQNGEDFIIKKKASFKEKLENVDFIFHFLILYPLYENQINYS